MLFKRLPWQRETPTLITKVIYTRTITDRSGTEESPQDKKERETNKKDIGI
jgi:hypothetical protein